MKAVFQSNEVFAFTKIIFSGHLLRDKDSGSSVFSAAAEKSFPMNAWLMASFRNQTLMLMQQKDDQRRKNIQKGMHCVSPMPETRSAVKTKTGPVPGLLFQKEGSKNAD